MSADDLTDDVVAADPTTAIAMDVPPSDDVPVDYNARSDIGAKISGFASSAASSVTSATSSFKDKWRAKTSQGASAPVEPGTGPTPPVVGALPVADGIAVADPPNPVAPVPLSDDAHADYSARQGMGAQVSGVTAPAASSVTSATTPFQDKWRANNPKGAPTMSMLNKTEAAATTRTAAQAKLAAYYGKQTPYRKRCSYMFCVPNCWCFTAHFIFCLTFITTLAIYFTAEKAVLQRGLCDASLTHTTPALSWGYGNAACVTQTWEDEETEQEYTTYTAVMDATFHSSSTSAQPCPRMFGKQPSDRHLTLQGCIDDVMSWVEGMRAGQALRCYIFKSGEVKQQKYHSAQLATCMLGDGEDERTQMPVELVVTPTLGVLLWMLVLLALGLRMNWGCKC